MKYFTYSDEDITYVPVKKRLISLKSFTGLLSITLLLTVLLISGFTVSDTQCTDEFEVETQVMVLKAQNRFTEDLFIRELVNTRVRFPHIVLAQSYLESERFSSPIWVENHNPFGMKLSKIRPTVSIGENRGHASYKTWKDSVVDYIIWQVSFTRNIYDEYDYLEYLDRVYAEDGSYKKKLISIIQSFPEDLYETLKVESDIPQEIRLISNDTN